MEKGIIQKLVRQHMPAGMWDPDSSICYVNVSYTKNTKKTKYRFDCQRGEIKMPKFLPGTAKSILNALKEVDYSKLGELAEDDCSFFEREIVLVFRKKITIKEI